MEYKYIKIDFNKFRIKFNGITFKDIDEFILDLRNILNQMKEEYKILNKNQLEKQKLLFNSNLKKLFNELQKRLNYITNSNKIAEYMVGKARPKLIQFKSLVDSMDITRDIEDNINKLNEFYDKRILT